MNNLASLVPLYFMFFFSKNMNRKKTQNKCGSCSGQFGYVRDCPYIVVVGGGNPSTRERLQQKSPYTNVGAFAI